ncbi:hypothetical protein AAHA92_09948 [Salvia divinorum]|uniref:Uncharacterized protein n=1 Tax=Salvia divinorum TaxID=28513 RepID=A0ABD1HT59_SALDI
MMVGWTSHTGQGNSFNLQNALGILYGFCRAKWQHSLFRLVIYAFSEVVEDYHPSMMEANFVRSLPASPTQIAQFRCGHRGSVEPAAAGLASPTMQSNSHTFGVSVAVLVASVGLPTV